MVNENHFRFDRKSLFNFWKTIYGRFPKLYSSSFHARLIFDCQNPAIVGRRNIGGTGIRQYPATGIIPAPESGHRNSAGAGIQRHPATVARCRRTRFRQNLAGYSAGIWPWLEAGRIWPKWPDPAKHARRNPATATGCCQIPATIAFLLFIIFSCEPNTEKYFRKSNFF
jgi:hypothetical protein